jgi:peptidoglycan/LPS O-acetylase OafA/YrhL
VALLRRAALAMAWTALGALVLVGALMLLPVDRDMDRYDAFTVVFLLLLPLMLAGAFEWRAARARGLRVTLCAAAAGAFGVAVLPWPHFVDRLGRGHGLVLLLFAAVTLAASRLPGRQTASLRELLGVD